MGIVLKILILLAVVAISFLAWPDYERTYTFDCSGTPVAFIMSGGECPVDFSYDSSTAKFGGGVRWLQNEFCTRDGTMDDTSATCLFTKGGFENRTMPWVAPGIIAVALITSLALFLPFRKIFSKR